TLLAVNAESDEALAHAGRLLAENRRASKQISRRRSGYAANDYSLDEVAPRDALDFAVRYDVRPVVHAGPPLVCLIPQPHLACRIANAEPKPRRRLKKDV